MKFFRFKKPTGTSVIEILVSLGIAAMLIIVIGEALLATHRLQLSSKMQQQALVHAKDYLERMGKIVNLSDLSSLSTSVELKISTAGILESGQESISSFNRYIVFNTVGGDTNRKQATVMVTWTEKSQPKQLSLSTIFTAWKKTP